MVQDVKRTATAPLRLPGTGALPAVPVAAEAAAVPAAAAPAPAAPTSDQVQLQSGTGPLSTAQLGQAQAVVPAAAAPPGPPPMDQIKAETKAAVEAQAAVTELETELAEAMARFGPAMTEDQRNAFITTFKAQHEGEYQALAAAQAQLAGTLAANQDALAAAMVVPDDLFDGLVGAFGDNEHELIMQAYQALGPAHAQVAADFAAKVLADPATAGQPALAKWVIEQLVQPNLTAIAAGAAGQADPQQAGAAAIAALQDTLGPSLDLYMANCRELPGELGEAFDMVRDLHDSLADMDQVFKSSADYFQDQLKAFAETWSAKSAMGKSMAVVGLVMGAMQIGPAMEQGLAETIRAIATTGQGALELILSIKTVATACPGLAAFGARMVPLLGAIANVANGISLLQKGDAVSMGAAGAEAVAAAGGLMLVFGIGTGGVGPAMVALGSLASMGIQSLGEWQSDQVLDREYYGILTDPKGLNMDPLFAGRLIELGPDTLQRFSQAYNIPVEDLPALLQEPGMSDLLHQPLPLTGDLQDATLDPFARFLNLEFRRPDGSFDGQAYLAFARAQRDAAGADNPEAGQFALIGGMLRSEVDRQGLPWPVTAEDWRKTLAIYEERIRTAPEFADMPADLRDAMLAHLKVMQERVR